MLKRLQEFDKCVLVTVAKAAAKIMALIYDVIGTLTKPHEVGNQICEDLPGFCVALSLYLLKIGDYSFQENSELAVAIESFTDITTFCSDVQVGQQTNRRTFWNGTDLQFILVQDSEKRFQRRLQISRRQPQIRCAIGSLDVARTRNLVTHK